MSNGYEIAFWLVTTVFGVILAIAGFFASNWARRIDENFKELFAKIDFMAEQKDFEKLSDKVSEHHDRLIKLEQKVYNCKNNSYYSVTFVVYKFFICFNNCVSKTFMDCFVKGYRFEFKFCFRKTVDLF